MRSRGLEPPRYCYHTDLNRARLPIPPRPHIIMTTYQSCGHKIDHTTLRLKRQYISQLFLSFIILWIIIAFTSEYKV
jgi:hypothetical protein